MRKMGIIHQNGRQPLEKWFFDRCSRCAILLIVVVRSVHSFIYHMAYVCVCRSLLLNHRPQIITSSWWFVYTCIWWTCNALTTNKFSVGFDTVYLLSNHSVIFNNLSLNEYCRGFVVQIFFCSNSLDVLLLLSRIVYSSKNEQEVYYFVVKLT